MESCNNQITELEIIDYDYDDECADCEEESIEESGETDK